MREIEKLKNQHASEKQKLIEDYEKKISDTARETREKVQKVYEKRMNQKDKAMICQSARVNNTANSINTLGMS